MARPARGSRRRAVTIQRTITFFEVLNGFGARIEEVDWPDLLDVIEGLDPDTDARYTARDGMELHGRVHRSKTGPDLLVISRTRRSGWPDQERHGAYSALELPEDTNLAESTHVAFFPRNVVGVLRGPEGPFVGRVEGYLMDKVDFGDDMILIRPILAPNVAEQLGRVDYLRRLHVRLPAQRADRLPASAPTLRGIVRSAHQRYGNVDLEITVKVPTRGADRESAAVFREIREVVERRTLEALDKADMTFVDHESGKNDELDLLTEKLTFGVDVAIRGRGRAVQESSASGEIQRAYDALRAEIERGIGVEKG